MSTDDLVVTRVIGAPPPQVFAAWTTPEVMARWLFAGDDWTAEVEADPVVDVAFAVLMLTPDGQRAMTITGRYLELDEPRRLVLSWTSDRVSDTRVIVELEDLGDSTGLTLTHQLVPPELQEIHEGGWGGCLRHLELVAVSLDRP